MEREYRELEAMINRYDETIDAAGKALRGCTDLLRPDLAERILLVIEDLELARNQIRRRLIQVASEIDNEIGV
jgi:hypothetical protein